MAPRNEAILAAVFIGALSGGSVFPSFVFAKLLLGDLNKDRPAFPESILV